MGLRGPKAKPSPSKLARIAELERLVPLAIKHPEWYLVSHGRQAAADLLHEWCTLTNESKPELWSKIIGREAAQALDWTITARDDDNNPITDKARLALDSLKEPTLSSIRETLESFGYNASNLHGYEYPRYTRGGPAHWSPWRNEHDVSFRQ